MKNIIKILGVLMLACLLWQCKSKETISINPEYNYLPVKINGTWGFINSEGNYLIYPKFSDVMPFSDGMAAVCEGEQWGFIDTLGRQLIEPQYREVTIFSEGKAFALNSQGKIVCIDHNNQILFTLHNADGCSVFRHGAAQVLSNGEVRYVNEVGETCPAPAEYDMPVFDPQVGNGPTPTADKDGRYGYADSTGRFVIAPAYDAAAGFRNHIAAVAQNGRVGFVNRKGEWVIEPRYEASYPQCQAVTSIGKDTLDLHGFAVRFLQGTNGNHFKGYSAAMTLQKLLDKGNYKVEAQALIRPSKTRLAPFVTLIETAYGFDEPIMTINKNLTFNYQDGFNHTNDSLQIEYTEDELRLRNMTFSFELADDYLSVAPRLLKELRDQLCVLMGTTYSRSNSDYTIANNQMKVELEAPVSQSDNRFTIQVSFLKRRR